MDHHPDSLSKLLDEYYEIEDEFADAEVATSRTAKRSFVGFTTVT